MAYIGYVGKNTPSHRDVIKNTFLLKKLPFFIWIYYRHDMSIIAGRPYKLYLSVLLVIYTRR